MSFQLHIHGTGGKFEGWWLDNSGGKPWSDIAGFNFDAMPGAPFDWRGTASGSYALSDKFSVSAGQELALVAILATAHARPFWDFGFALLVQGKNVVKILFDLRPDGINQIGDIGPNVFLAPPSAGVTVNAKTKDATGIVLNGVDYGQDTNPGDGDVATFLSSECTPAAGEYQILFGIFATLNMGNAARPAALIEVFVNVI